MADYIHPTSYRFYIQKLNSGSKIDIESTYNCRYKQFKDIANNGDIHNSYSEIFVENDGEKLWLPNQKDITYAPYDCTLELLFKGDNCQKNARDFYEYIEGERLEYSDTFRNRFLLLSLLKAPSIQMERLYGNQKYMLVSYTFRNYKGRSYNQSQIK